MNNVSGFTFFRSYHESLKDLETEDRRELLEAIVNFVFDDTEPELTGFKKTIWTLMAPNLNQSKTKSKNAQKEAKEKQTKNKKKTNKKQKEKKPETKENQIENSDLLEDKEKEMDKEMELNKNKEEEKNKNTSISSMSTTNIYEFLEQNFGRTITPLEYEKINSWIDEFDEEMVRHGISSAVLNGVKKFSYLEAIFRNWKSSGFKKINDILEHETKMHSSKEEKDFDEVINNIFDYNWLEEGSND